MPADRRPGAAEISGAAKNAASSNVKMLPAARPPAFCDVKMAATLVQGAICKEPRPRGAVLTGRLSMPTPGRRATPAPEAAPNEVRRDGHVPGVGQRTVIRTRERREEAAEGFGSGAILRRRSSAE